MTKEEEIVRIVFDSHIRDLKAISTKKDRPIFDMLEEVKNKAIKALEQPTSNDCISRKAVIDSIDSIREHHGGMLDVRAVVSQLPSVTPMQNWIPIIRREPTEEEKKDYFEQNGEELAYMIDSPMPNNGQEVLVSVGDTVGEDIFDEDFWNFEGWDIADVEAWMPLPKPYEEKTR